MKRRPTLFRRTATTIVGGFVVFMLVALGILFPLWLTPLIQRSADDFAAVLVLSAQTWYAMPSQDRPAFAAMLERDYGIRIVESGATADDPVDDDPAPARPYLMAVEDALERRLGTAFTLKGARADRFRAAIPVEGGRVVEVSFPHSRFRPRPAVSAAVVLATAVVLAVVLAWLLARRVAAPVTQLADAARQLGAGEHPAALPETGDGELAVLAREINQTSAKLAAQRLNQETLLAGVSHDLRSPLARLRMATGMLAEESNSPLVARMEADIDAMDMLIGAQLQLARAREHEPMRDVDLDALLRDVASTAGYERRVELRTRGPATRVRTAPVALRRVLANLVDNAVRHGGGRAFQIVRRQYNGAVMIGVRDRGPGIASGYREAIFRPYFRVEPSRNRATGGSGLGLAIARQLCDTHGWRIAVKPRVGGGASFWLVVPGQPERRDVQEQVRTA